MSANRFFEGGIQDKISSLHFDALLVVTCHTASWRDSAPGELSDGNTFHTTLSHTFQEWLQKSREPASHTTTTGSDSVPPRHYLFPSLGTTSTDKERTILKRPTFGHQASSRRCRLRSLEKHRRDACETQLVKHKTHDSHEAAELDAHTTALHSTHSASNTRKTARHTCDQFYSENLWFHTKPPDPLICLNRQSTSSVQRTVRGRWPRGGAALKTIKK